MSDEHEWIEVMDDMAGGPMVYKSEADEAIATLTAERDALVEAIDAFRHIDRSGRRDIDLIRGDLMQRITELTTERDELRDAVLDIRGCEVVMLTPSASPGDLVQKTTYTYVADPKIQRAIEIASKLEPHDD